MKPFSSNFTYFFEMILTIHRRSLYCFITATRTFYKSEKNGIYTISNKPFMRNTYPFPNFNGATIKVGEWIRSSTPYFCWAYAYSTILGLKWIRVDTICPSQTSKSQAFFVVSFANQRCSKVLLCDSILTSSFIAGNSLCERIRRAQYHDKNQQRKV